MKVTLAGATLDRRFWKEDPAATPETISAAYARISHSPKTIDKLRDEAVEHVESARRSNETIVYKMGHSSIAEHAVFNIDLEDCSRLLVEFVERHRLASFTERSQRYVFFGDKAPIQPPELNGSVLGKMLSEIDAERFEMYNYLIGREELKAKYGDSLLEEARYILGLTCPTDIGMTVNARELEHILARASVHPLSEVRELSGLLRDAAGSLAPSLIKYTDEKPFRKEAAEGMLRAIGRFLEEGKGSREEIMPRRAGKVCSELPSMSEDPESEVIAALIFELTDMDLPTCRSIARDLDDDEMREFLRPVFEGYPVHASLPRAFEMMDIVFDLEISASAFAQLKRHRMATLITQRYSPRSWETPRIMLEDPDIAARYVDLMKRGAELHDRVKERFGPDVAQYCLCNADRRRVVLKMNLRELYHFVRLRSDVHAQSEIRRISDGISKVMVERYPVISSMLCGKDGFDDARFCFLGK